MEFLISYDQDKKNTPIVRKLTEETEVRLRMSLDGDTNWNNGDLETLTVTDEHHCTLSSSVLAACDALGYVLSLGTADCRSKESRCPLRKLLASSSAPPTPQLPADSVGIVVRPALFRDPLPGALVLDLQPPSTSVTAIPEANIDAVWNRRRMLVKNSCQSRRHVSCMRSAFRRSTSEKCFRAVIIIHTKIKKFLV